MEGTSQEVDLQARERIFAVLSRGRPAVRRSGASARGVGHAPQVRAATGNGQASARHRARGDRCCLARPRPDGPRTDRRREQKCRGHSAKRARYPERAFFLRPEIPPLAIGLHTPLLWLPNMTWTGGWMPSPYAEERVLQEIMNAQIPLKGPTRARRCQRRSKPAARESAFVPAYMLVNIAHWFGMSESDLGTRYGQSWTPTARRRRVR